MKKMILMGISLLVMVGVSFGQENKAEDGAREKVADLTQKLNLDESQQAALYPVVLDFKNASMALKNDASLTEDTRKEQLQSLKSTMDEKVRAELTEEQKPLYEQIVSDRQQKKERR